METNAGTLGLSAPFFTQNRTDLARALEEDTVLLVFAGRAPRRSADSEHIFLADRSFFYLTGFEEPEAVLLIAKHDGRVEERLFLRPKDAQRERWTGRRSSPEEAASVSGIASVRTLDRYETEFKDLIDSGSYRSVSLDLSGYDAHPGDDPVHRFASRIHADHPHVLVENVHSRLAALRSLKKPEEVALLRVAIERTGRGIEAMAAACRPGAMEYEMAAAFRYAIAREGCAEPAFPSIVATGRNAFFLHYDKPTARIEDGDLVQIDVGATFGGLNADISRSLPANGRFSPRQRELYSLVLRCQEAAFAALRPGVVVRDVNEASREAAYLGLRDLKVLERRDQVDEYFWHGVSHHLGLDVHDIGSRSVPIEAGMVFTVEPGLYVPEWGMGIRIEDDALVTEDGCVDLSPSIPKTIDAIERLMAEAGAVSTGKSARSSRQ
jgi:Xaa-Pro aminopeptidase